MVKPDLTTEMIDAGRHLLELIDRQSFPAPACFWFYFAESERWRFVIASPEVRIHGPHAAYRKIEALARKVPNASELFAPGDLTVVKDNDPLVLLLRKAISTGSGISGIRFTANAINGTFVDDAYIYRLPLVRRRSNFRVNPPGEAPAGYPERSADGRARPMRDPI